METPIISSHRARSTSSRNTIVSCDGGPTAKPSEAFEPLYAARPLPQPPDLGEKAPDLNDRPPDLDDRPPDVISPYIGVRAKLTRSWATYTVILLLLNAVLFILNAQTAGALAAQALENLQTGCNSVKAATESALNMPRTLAEGTVATIEDASQSIVEFAGHTLQSTLSAIQSLIVWVIRMYAGTTICIAEVLVRAALSLVEEASEMLTEALEGAINGVVGTLQKAAGGITGAIDDVANGIGDLFGAISDKVDIPKLDLSDEVLKKNLTVEIPTGWIDGIRGLEDKIPTEDEIFANITAILNKPFSAISDAINRTFSNVEIDLRANIDFAPRKTVDMCNDALGKDSVEGMAHDVTKIMHIAAGVMIALAVCVVCFECALILRDNRRFQSRLAQFRSDLADYLPVRDAEARESAPATREELDLFILPGRPLLGSATRYIQQRRGTTDKVLLWRWFFDYIYHPPSIACFVSGLVGILCIWGQIAGIQTLRTVYVPKLAAELDEFQTQYLDETLLGGIRNDSALLAADINSGLEVTESTLNDKLFDPVTKGTAELNSTLDNVVAEYIGVINKVFGGTPLETPVAGLVNCTVTKNIRSVQKILTFVNDNAHVSLARISDDVLLRPAKTLVSPLNSTANALKKLAVGVHIPDADELDPESFMREAELDSLGADQESSEVDSDAEEDERVVSREDVVAAQKYNDYTGGIIGGLCDSYVRHLKNQIPLMAALMAVWVLVVCAGLGYVFVRMLRNK